MRLFLVFMIGFTCSLSANSYAQQERVSLSMKDVTVKMLFDEIQRQTDLHFIFNTEQTGRLGKLSLEVKEETVEKVLNRIFEGTDLVYIFRGNVILVKPKAEMPVQPEMVRVTGKVTDERKSPMPGVTVRLKGVSIGTATNAVGVYSFTFPKSNDATLVFSFVGMESREVKYTGQDTINVVLREAVSEMDEVTVVSTGYQTVNRKDMVGSYTTLKAEDIMMPAYSTIDQMLQGQVPGMIVKNTSARAGTSPKIQIRGTSTILGNQDPIWVVDGIIQDDPISLNASTDMTLDMREILGNQISWLNPNDIETITVLKDASATAIYGSRASNGVIVITTKKGKLDRLSISYSGNMSFSPRPRYGRFKWMDSQERIQFSEEAYEAGLYYQEEPLAQTYTYEGLLKMYQAGLVTQKQFVERRNYLETVNTDWLDLLTRATVNHNHNLSVSGASSKANYTISAGYNKTDGQEIGNSSERLTARAVVGIDLRTNMKVNLTINGAIGRTDGFNGVNPLNYALNTSRAIPAFNEDGSYAFYRKDFKYNYNSEAQAIGIGYNVLNELENTGSKVKNGLLSMNLNFSWKFLSWLEYQFTGGYSYNSTNSSSYKGERSTSVAATYRGYDYGSITPDSPWFKAALLPFGGELFTSAATVSSYNIQNKLLLSKQLNENHRFNVMLGLEVRSSTTNNDLNTRWGYVKDRGNLFVAPTLPQNFKSLGSWNMSGFGILEELYKGKAAVNEKTDNFFSFFATLAYSLKNRYVFNFNVRNDVSNRFGQDVNKRFDPTYSLGFSWRVTEESFMKNQQWLSALNLKGTWGIQGNALLNQSPELILKQLGVAGIHNEYYSVVSSIPNPNLSWERTHSWNFGVDMQLFRKVNVNVDYYLRRSNAILSREIPFENGLNNMSINGGIIYNKGLEFTVALTPVNTKNFGLNLSLNSSKNWNSTGKAPMEQNVALSDYLGGRTNMLVKKGYPLGAMWSYDFKGLNPDNGRPEFNRMEFSEENPYDEDMTSFLVYSGQKDPYFTGGLNLNIRYRSFSVGTSFSLLLGGKTRLKSAYANLQGGGHYMPDPYSNVRKDVAKRWKKSGDEKNTNIPAFMQSDYYFKLPSGVSVDLLDMYEKSNELLVKSSFLRCRGLNLSWRLNKESAERIGLNSLTVSMSVNNLFVIASKRFQGYDPELQDSVLPKNYSVGINVGF